MVPPNKHSSTPYEPDLLKARYRFYENHDMYTRPHTTIVVLVKNWLSEQNNNDSMRLQMFLIKILDEFVKKCAYLCKIQDIY